MNKRRKNSFTTEVVDKNVLKVSFDLVSNLHRLDTLVLADPGGAVYPGINNIHAARPQAEFADALVVVGVPQNERHYTRPKSQVIEKVEFKGGEAYVHKYAKSPAWDSLQNDLEKVIDQFLND